MRTPAQRVAHAAFVARVRAAKKAAGECRQCPKPAARTPDGRSMSACIEHLDADMERGRDRRAAKKGK